MDKLKSTFIVITSQVGSFFSSCNIEEQRYSLKTFLLNFFKIQFVVRSRGCSKWVMFFGVMTILMSYLTTVPSTFVVDFALNASHINGLFNPAAKLSLLLLFYIRN